MRFAVVGISVVSLLSCSSVQGEVPPPSMINVLYSVVLAQNDAVELSVYNPTDQTACTSVLNWPSPAMLGDTLHIVGRDGQKWNYVGPEPSIVGKPQDLKIAPRSEVSARVDIRKYYKPVSSETRVGKVYYGAPFHNC